MLKRYGLVYLNTKAHLNKQLTSKSPQSCAAENTLENTPTLDKSQINNFLKFKSMELHSMYLL